MRREKSSGKNPLTILVITILFGSLLCGCQTQRDSSSSIQVSSAVEKPTKKNPHATWSNGYALLHDLLAQEADVDKLHFIKKEQPDVKELINRIASASGVAAKQLEGYAGGKSAFVLKETELPPGEESTRDAIASTKKWELLGHTGDQFELNLLLTQSEAMSYGWHLAKVASKNDANPDRARYLANLSEQMKGFYHDLYLIMLSRMNEGAPGKK
jgi:hypothetical protein